MDEALALAVENEFGVVDEGHAVGVGKVLCSFTDESRRGGLFLEGPDVQPGWDCAAALDAGHAASLHASAVHEESVELDAAIGV